jgi:hypothetical protein
MKVFRRGSFFRIPVEKVRPLTVQEQRERRAEELRITLGHLNAQAESLNAQIAEFRFEHKNPLGGYRAASLEELGTLPDKERELNLAVWHLNERRNPIIAELSELTVNENEVSHIAGKVVPT